MSIIVKSLEEYIAHIRRVAGQSKIPRTLFYRGHPDSSYQLIPSIHRTQITESSVTQQFRSQAPSLVNNVPHNDLDHWLFLMQHHGLPTRLLDWTESPLVALYFALSGETHSEDASIYLLNPMELNKSVLGGGFFPDRADPRYNYRFLRAFYRNPEVLPWDIGIDLEQVDEKEIPLALRPIIVHPRMVAQKAAFTVHGDDERDLISILNDRNIDALSHLTIPNSARKRVKRDLELFGVTESTIFPDLDGLASELKQKYGRL